MFAAIVRGDQIVPYRYSHWALLLVLAPAIAIAFWRDYFGALTTASWAFHAHGLTASLWIALVAAQSWTAHARRFAWHRLAGRAVLVAVPLFAGAAGLVVHSMALKTVGGHPFYGIFGARLGLTDIVITAVLVAMVRQALRNRRRVALHAGYMLGTVLLVLPPVIERLPLPLPRGLHLSELLPMTIAAILYARHRRDGAPWLVVIGAMVAEILVIEVFGVTASWSRCFAAISTMPASALAIPAIAAAAIAIWTAWTPLKASARRAAVPGA